MTRGDDHTFASMSGMLDLSRDEKAKHFLSRWLRTPQSLCLVLSEKWLEKVLSEILCASEELLLRSGERSGFFKFEARKLQCASQIRHLKQLVPFGGYVLDELRPRRIDGKGFL